jgi:hypothetical protein
MWLEHLSGGADHSHVHQDELKILRNRSEHKMPKKDAQTIEEISDVWQQAKQVSFVAARSASCWLQISLYASLQLLSPVAFSNV